MGARAWTDNAKAGPVSRATRVRSGVHSECPVIMRVGGESGCTARAWFPVSQPLPPNRPPLFAHLPPPLPQPSPGGLHPGACYMRWGSRMTGGRLADCDIRVLPHHYLPPLALQQPTPTAVVKTRVGGDGTGCCGHRSGGLGHGGERGEKLLGGMRAAVGGLAEVLATTLWWHAQ